MRHECIERFLNGITDKEIRSWKTNHRGELLLHCSIKDAPTAMGGYIVARCDLTAMTWNYENERFEWTLKNVKPLSKKIKVKGKLGLWNYEGNWFHQSPLASALAFLPVAFFFAGAFALAFAFTFGAFFAALAGFFAIFKSPKCKLISTL